MNTTKMKLNKRLVAEYVNNRQLEILEREFMAKAVSRITKPGFTESYLKLALERMWEEAANALLDTKAIRNPFNLAFSRGINSL